MYFYLENYYFYIIKIILTMWDALRKEHQIPVSVPEEDTTSGVVQFSVGDIIGVWDTNNRVSSVLVSRSHNLPVFDTSLEYFQSEAGTIAALAYDTNDRLWEMEAIYMRMKKAFVLWVYKKLISKSLQGFIEDELHSAHACFKWEMDQAIRFFCHYCQHAPDTETSLWNLRAMHMKNARKLAESPDTTYEEFCSKFDEIFI